MAWSDICAIHSWHRVKLRAIHSWHGVILCAIHLWHSVKLCTVHSWHKVKLCAIRSRHEVKLCPVHSWHGVKLRAVHSCHGVKHCAHSFIVRNECGCHYSWCRVNLCAIIRYNSREKLFSVLSFTARNEHTTFSSLRYSPQPSNPEVHALYQCPCAYLCPCSCSCSCTCSYS